jgi:hypothetical protein
VGGNITEELYLTQSFDIANTSYDIGDSLNIIFDAQPSGSNIAVETK